MMTQQRRKPTLLKLKELSKASPRLLFWDDDVVYTTDKYPYMIQWAFYGEYKKDKTLTRGVIDIPLERTVRLTDPLDYWSVLIEEFSDCSITLAADSDAARRRLPSIDPRWHSMKLLFDAGDVNYVIIYFSLLPDHHYCYREDDLEDVALTLRKAYETSFEEHRSAVVIATGETDRFGDEFVDNLYEKLDELSPFELENTSTIELDVSKFNSLQLEIPEYDTADEHGNRTELKKRFDSSGMFAVLSSTVKRVDDALAVFKSLLGSENVHIYRSTIETEYLSQVSYDGKRWIDTSKHYEPPIVGNKNLRLVLTPAFNVECRWKCQQRTVLDICIAFANIWLPPYVILWITDFIEILQLQSHRKRIHFIEAVVNSMRRVQERREERLNGAVSKRTRSKLLLWSTVAEKI